MELYVVDAFTDKLFAGNPAAVCPLDNWLPDTTMQSIAFENNLAETAFVVPENGHYHIRWFTPTTEVDLCGHATLASSHVLFNHKNYKGEQLKFNSRSGVLTVTKNEEQLTLDFPADTYEQVIITPKMRACISAEILEAYKGKTDYMFVLNSEKDVETATPNFDVIAKLQGRGLIITSCSKGGEVDFVSRFFGPQSGINEDPVTGSAHTTLTPYWAEKLGKTEMTALQLSQRMGKLHCRLEESRVKISGKAVTYLTGNINIRS